jgi:hypothetical protein
MDPSSTSSITEFAIVVAGFTGLVFALEQTDGPINPFVKFRTVTMLFYAFSAAFGSVLPTIVDSFRLADDIWFAASICLIPILLANMLATVVASRRILTNEERPQLKGWMWSLVMVGNSIFALWLAGNALGLMPGQITGAFFSALLWQLVLSAILFTRLLVIR